MNRMENSKYSREQLIKALQTEYIASIEEDFNPDEDPTAEEYLAWLQSCPTDELIAETYTDSTYTLDQYIARWLS